MAIHFACPVCKTAYTVHDKSAGHKAECKVCGQRLQIPAPAHARTILGEVIAPSPATPPSPLTQSSSPASRPLELPPLLPASRHVPEPAASPGPPPDRPRPAPRASAPPPLPPPVPPLPPLRERPGMPLAPLIAIAVVGLGTVLGGILVVVLVATRGTDPDPTMATQPSGNRTTGPKDVAWVDHSPPASRDPEPAPVAGDQPLAAEEVYRRLVRSCCLIISPHGAGSGFVVHDGGRLAVTNYHVVGSEAGVAVVFPLYDRGGELITDARQYQQRGRAVAVRGVVIDRDPTRDLALVRVDRLPARTGAAPLAPRPAAAGTTVYSVGGSGADANLVWRLTKGMVRGRAQRRQKADFGITDCMILETDAPINVGDSGGPVMNDRGEVVGVVSHYLVGQRQVSGNIDVQEVRQFVAPHMTGR